MQKSTAHSRSSLFLMEMILSILILALTCTACVRIFAAAKTQRQEARELNHIQELATCAGEALEGWDGEPSSFAVKEKSDSKHSTISTSAESYQLNYYYDRDWNSCDKDSAEYTMDIQLKVSDSTKTADLDFYNSTNKNLYHLSISFPFTARKDGQS